MPETKVVFYKDDNASSPVLDWLIELQEKNETASEKCWATIKELEANGHELRRPTAATLRDGIMELRARHLNVRYRILYFFHGRGIAILAHAIEKKVSAVPDEDIKKAIKYKKKFEEDPKKHTWEEDEDA